MLRLDEKDLGILFVPLDPAVTKWGLFKHGKFGKEVFAPIEEDAMFDTLDDAMVHVMAAVSLYLSKQNNGMPQHEISEITIGEPQEVKKDE